MLSRAQQILIKRAQREAALDDAEYREALQVVSGCRSSTDARMTDRHFDLALAYFEAIYWRKLDSAQLQPNCKANAVFKQRRYWAEKNTRQETSRDRYTQSKITVALSDLESALAEIGLGAAYCASIRQKVTQGREDAYSLHLYRAALQRTLDARRRKFAGREPATTSKV